LLFFFFSLEEEGKKRRQNETPAVILSEFLRKEKKGEKHFDRHMPNRCLVAVIQYITNGKIER
jgi:hypothetical protein